MKIILIGPPGAGKGTYAAGLKEEFKALHLSTGEMLREAVASKSDLGNKAKEFMDAGKLVPDELVINLVNERVARDDAKDAVFFDGFPRTVKQAEMLINKMKIDSVLNFMVPDKVILDRLTSRRTCSSCGEIYNVNGLMPAVEGKCDKCGEAVIQRDDDKVEVIQNRLNVYRQSTEPLIGFFTEHKLLKTFDSNKKPENVVKECSTFLKSL